MTGTATLVRNALLALLMATSMLNVNVNAFMTSPPSTVQANNMIKRSANGHGTKLFLDLASASDAAAGGIDFVDSVTHAWESYNLALENDPLVTK